MNIWLSAELINKGYLSTENNYIHKERALEPLCCDQIT